MVWYSNWGLNIWLRARSWLSFDTVVLTKQSSSFTSHLCLWSMWAWGGGLGTLGSWRKVSWRSRSQRRWHSSLQKVLGWWGETHVINICTRHQVARRIKLLQAVIILNKHGLTYFPLWPPQRRCQVWICCEGIKMKKSFIYRKSETSQDMAKSRQITTLQHRTFEEVE